MKKLKCDSGWSNPKTCNDDLDECLNSPCLNNGTCVNEIGSFKCQCSNSFVGNLCENKIDYCAFEPCNHLNTVKCENNYILNNFVCVCKPGKYLNGKKVLLYNIGTYYEILYHLY